MSSNNEAGDNSSRQHEELMEQMQVAKDRWARDGASMDETDRLLDEAIGMAIEQGKGWDQAEREEYMAKILDDDFIPPIFASTQEELEKTGLAEAFSALNYDDSPAVVMLEFKQKGADAFLNGKRNEANNVQWFRDAVNHYYEAFAWAEKIEPVEEQKEGASSAQESPSDPCYSELELSRMKSTLRANAALAHMQLKNWGYVRDDCKKALSFNKSNVKAWYRLAKAHEMLHEWEKAGDAIENGLACPGEAENVDLQKLRRRLQGRVQNARKSRQLREKKRAERSQRIKELWRHCKDNQIQLGRVPLVASISDDDEDADDAMENIWHLHHPHTGQIPELRNGEWSWPCLFVYPSHNQSDFVKNFGETEMLALRLAEMFPELEDGDSATSIVWDIKNEFVCSKLAVYFEVHSQEEGGGIVHPDSVDRLLDQGSAMRFFESSVALRGDEGPEMANLARAIERKRLFGQQKRWIEKHGSLWAKPGTTGVIRVHPAVTLREVLTHRSMIVPNFLVTFVVIPEDNPFHEVYLKEHACVGVLQHENS